MRPVCCRGYTCFTTFLFLFYRRIIFYDRVESISCFVTLLKLNAYFFKRSLYVQLFSSSYLIYSVITLSCRNVFTHESLFLSPPIVVCIGCERLCSHTASCLVERRHSPDTSFVPMLVVFLNAFRSHSLFLFAGRVHAPRVSWTV